MPQEKFVLAIDQGTTSTRAIIFDHSGRVVANSQQEITQILPQPGWVEHDPLEIWDTVRSVVADVLAQAQLNQSSLAAVGITNQRETTVVWDQRTGEPVHNAIVWQDTRTHQIVEDLDRFRHRTGLGLSTYFSGPKLKWILESVPQAREDAEQGHLLFGTIDSWLLWNLTGGVDGGVHATDVTNASRTQLMDLRTLQWDPEICAELDIPLQMLPTIRSSAGVFGYGRTRGLLVDVPIAGILGDQHAALFGQACFEAGTAKNTYGTGCFLLLNTGPQVVYSDNGLLTTVAYQIGGEAPRYALEGSVAVTGSLVQWTRDNLGLIDETDQIETLANTVPNNGGVYIVPAFSGLFAPYWREDARGAILGLTRFNNRGHLARATLEATAFQTREVVDAMENDAGEKLKELRADGGMIRNGTLMQIQADILGVDVVAPEVAETTALGAAYAAGIAVGYWEGEADVKANWREAHRWSPQMAPEEAARQYRLWRKAVTRTFSWVDEDVKTAPQ